MAASETRRRGPAVLAAAYVNRMAGTRKISVTPENDRTDPAAARIPAAKRRAGRPPIAPKPPIAAGTENSSPTARARNRLGRAGTRARVASSC
jgi:hypothetical protein